MRFFFLWILCVSFSYSQSFGLFIQRLLQSPAEERSGIVERYLSTQKSAPIVENDTLVHFVFYGAANRVLINGDLQRWLEPDTLHTINCGNNSLFYRTFILPSDARLDYIFIVDGREMLDPANPLTTQSGFGSHSEVQMPKFVPSPFLLYRSEIAHGRIEDVPVNPYVVAPLKQYWRGARPLKIYLPPGYDTLSNLPVVYVQDGFETIEFASLPTIIDNLIADQKIMPVISVFIPPLRREEEQMGFLRDQYKKYLCDELVPMIDKKYKTGRSPNKRALIGISSAGNASLYVAFTRPDIFLNTGGQSTAITPALEEITRQKAVQNLLPASMKIYLDCGRYDMRRYSNDDFLTLNRTFSEFLSSLRIPHYYKEVNDGHQWGSWRERMPEMLMYFFRKKFLTD
ncbi:MAG: alpha/beta hydrolase-fold protein [Bacteroidota bacterium]